MSEPRAPEPTCPICEVDGSKTKLHNGACWMHGTPYEGTAMSEAPVSPAVSPLIHYGSHGGAECGAHGNGRVPEAQLTKEPNLVTCPTCRGWLPIVHSWKPAPTLPKRDVRALTEALRVRAMALTGEKWERNATRDMMKEAADALEELRAALSTPAPRPETEDAARELQRWRDWAQFTFHGGGKPAFSDDESRARICAAIDAEVELAAGAAPRPETEE